MDKKGSSLNRVRNFKKKLLKKFNVSKIILFGSVARGEDREWSDVDLIIVSENFESVKKIKRAVALYDYWTYKYPVDFLCYTPEEFDELKGRVGIVSQAIKEGIEI